MAEISVVMGLIGLCFDLYRCCRLHATIKPSVSAELHEGMGALSKQGVGWKKIWRRVSRTDMRHLASKQAICSSTRRRDLAA